MSAWRRVTGVNFRLWRIAALAERGLSVSSTSTWRFLDRRGITLKKSAHADEQSRPDVLKRRQDWFEQQLDLDPARLVFLDDPKGGA